MEVAKRWLKRESQSRGQRSPLTESTAPGQSPLELLPYEIRANILTHLSYTHVYLVRRIASVEQDEAYYYFVSFYRQINAYARRYGYKSRIVAMEYERGKPWPTTTTVKLPGKNRLIHIQNSGFDPVLLWVSRTIRTQALTLLYHGATVKFGHKLKKAPTCRFPSFLSLKSSVRLSVDHFACMRSIQLTEEVDKDHRNDTYNSKRQWVSPIKDLILSLRFIANSCPQLVSLSVEPNHRALIRSKKRFILKLVTAIVRIVRKCGHIEEVRLGLRRSVLIPPNRWVERVKFVKLELESFEKVHQLRIVEEWVGKELGYLAAIQSYIRFLPTEVELWS